MSRFAALGPIGLVLLAACSEAAPGANMGGSAGAALGGSGTAGANSGGAGGGTTAGTAAGGNGTSGSAGAGGSAGAVGGGGAAGSGGAIALVMPVERGDVDVLEFGGMALTVKPSVGARITSLRIGQDELLTGPTENERFYGSTLWTSPADDWVVGPFDPPAAVDRDPYTTKEVRRRGAQRSAHGPLRGRAVLQRRAQLRGARGPQRLQGHRPRRDLHPNGPLVFATLACWNEPRGRQR